VISVTRLADTLIIWKQVSPLGYNHKPISELNRELVNWTLSLILCQPLKATSIKLSEKNLKKEKNDREMFT